MDTIFSDSYLHFLRVIGKGDSIRKVDPLLRTNYSMYNPVEINLQ